MTLRVVDIADEERDLWDQAVVAFPHAHPLNAYGWGKVRAIDGWQPFYYVAREGDAIKGMIMVLVKKVPWTGLSIMYAPKGPLCAPDDLDTLKGLLKVIREKAKEKGVIFLRIDPNIDEDYFREKVDPFVDEGFIQLEHRWSFWNSPRDVYRIELSHISTEEELFMSINRDARRCVRNAQKEGVTIRPAETIEELRRFYDIFRDFSVEKGFLCRQLQYQEILWHEYIATGNGRLFLAIYGGQIIGGLLCILFAGKCLAMHMGTPALYNKLQTNYSYVWESIRWAKERGCSWYSFRGVGTTPTQESFKRKFHPQAVALVGYYDLPFRPLLYRIFYGVEFKILPLTWRTLMRLRKSYARFVDKVKIEKLAPAQAD